MTLDPTPHVMSKIIDTLVIYQENGLPHEKVVEIPAGLSNTEFLNFVHASIGESANIINIINIEAIKTILLMVFPIFFICTFSF